MPDTWPNTGTLLRSPSGQQSGPEGLFLPLLLGSVCANYPPPQLYNQAVVSSFLAGPDMKLRVCCSASIFDERSGKFLVL